ncbi:MAG: BolA family transcriptional regulator [Bdellovibrionaceae bacterium]|nr:BolA family transcriptional regulator [Pseudobdellovibrionaceae bacterium]NUM59219.1 BolA family transcriptional regulator [Pseudobdellovibrionaceae bacterium]
MKIQTAIKEKITLELLPIELQIENESDLHSGPKGRETHFKLLIVSEKFQDLSRLQRQQLVFKILALELNSGVHALSQRTYTPLEWEKIKTDLQFNSPECLGNTKN